MRYQEFFTESVEKPMTQCSSPDLTKILGKGKTNALVKHPWFQDYRNYEHAFRHGVSSAGFTKVDVFSYFSKIHTTPEGRIRPLILVTFTFSFHSSKIIQAEKYYRDKEPDENEKRLGPSAGWKHFGTWAKDEDLVNKAWDKHWDKKEIA